MTDQDIDAKPPIFLNNHSTETSAVGATPPVVDTQLLDFLRSSALQSPLPRPQTAGSMASPHVSSISGVPAAETMTLSPHDTSDFRSADFTVKTPVSDHAVHSRNGVDTMNAVRNNNSPLTANHINGTSVPSSQGAASRDPPVVSPAAGSFKMPGPSPPLSRVGSRQNSSPSVTIIFTNPQTSEEDIIQSRYVSTIPQHALEQLMTLGQSMDQGSRKILDLGHSFYHTTSRLKQYLERKAYMPFSPRIPLRVIDATGTSREWSGNGSLISDVRRSTEETHKLFTSELMMYKRATFLKYDEIREYSSHKIRTAYPILVQEVIAMLDRLYKTASESKDEIMVKFIKEATAKHAEELMGLPTIQDIIRQSINEHSPGSILLDMVLKTNTKARANLFLDSALTQSPPMPQQLQTPTSPMELTPIKTEPIHSSNGSLNRERDEAEHLRRIYETISNGRLLVAKNDGYGTLIGNHSAGKRNRDFKFKRAELLLADFDVPSTRHNMIVINARGQKGDILESFMVRVHVSDIGIEGEEVHLGSSGNTVPFDREERGFRPAGLRARSRSPDRR